MTDGPHFDAHHNGDPAQTITDVPGRDSSRLFNPGSQKHQGMHGFDDDYVDIVDYIVRSTHKIWEDKGIGLIYNHYLHNAVIHTSDGLTYGRDKVIADSIKTMAAFPDIRLFADDVIWSGNDRDGFHSSHRIRWVGRNTGHSIYGPPTGRRVVRQGIAHCFVKDNRIIEEWIVRDELALIRQLGLDEHELARVFAARDAASGVKYPALLNQGEIERVRGQATPDVPAPAADDGEDLAAFVQRSTYEIWNWRLLNTIDQRYAPNYICCTSTNRELYGLGDFKAYVLAWMAAFSDLRLTIDHHCAVGDKNLARSALRWTIEGTHDGPGVYGTPTGKRIRIIGITHHVIENGTFIKEWTVFDEFALLKQLYAPDASAA